MTHQVHMVEPLAARVRGMDEAHRRQRLEERGPSALEVSGGPGALVLCEAPKYQDVRFAFHFDESSFPSVACGAEVIALQTHLSISVSLNFQMRPMRCAGSRRASMTNRRLGVNTDLRDAARYSASFLRHPRG